MKTMSNNKNSMKLYTEVDLKDFIDRNGCIVQSDLEENQLNPIEVPTDEELEKEVSDYSLIQYKNGFRRGVRWMREKIKVK